MKEKFLDEAEMKREMERKEKTHQNRFKDRDIEMDEINHRKEKKIKKVKDKQVHEVEMKREMERKKRNNKIGS